MSLAGSTFKHNGAEAIVDSMAPRAKAVGIDLGTTYTCVGVWRSNDRTVEIIPNEHGNRTTPSVVAFTDIERLIGQSAVNQLLSNPSNTVFDAKRLIGRRFSDETVHTDRRLWPFTIEAGADDKPLIAVRFKGEQKKFTAEDISAMILLRMRDAAESYLGCQIKRAVITVPAYFNDAQRRATRDAGRVAGFDVLQILNEPTASAIAYGVVAKSKGGQNVLVFDLGGGTFDVSVLHVRQRKVSVKAVGGDTHLGGEDFNNRLVAHLVQEFQRKHAECNVWGEQRALRRLHCASERAKRELSFSSETVIEVPCLHGGHDLHATLSRAMFERLNQDLFDRCLRVVSECLADAAMTKTDIDKVILVGGSTRIPKIQAMLSYHFGGSQKLCKGLHPDEAVAFGAAVQAAMLNRERNAMEVVLRDVTPLSLGISTRGGLMSVIIPRNTPVPFRKECRYTTSHDNQNRMRFSVFEGERPDVKHNNFIGYVDLQDLPPAPRGALLAVITMEVDSSGILTVKAEHRTLGLREEARFCTSASSFAPEDPFVGDLIAEAESLRADDRVWKKKLLLRNELESLIYDMRKKADQERLLGLIEVADLARIQAVLDAAGEWVSAKSQATQAELELKIKEVKAVCQGLHYRKEAKREVSGASVSVTCLPGFRLRRSRNKLQ